MKSTIIAIVLLAIGAIFFAITSYYTLIDVQKYPQKPVFDSHDSLDNTEYPKRTLNNTGQYHIVQMGGDKTLFIASIVLVPAGIATFFYREDLQR